jgi:hypothetical protein
MDLATLRDRTTSMKATFCAIVLAAGVLAASAGADGLPVLGIDVGAKGVALPKAQDRFVTAAVGQDTIVARVDRRSGRVRSSRILRGPLTIPAVAYDGSAAGLSASGTSLVLIAPRVGFPRETTGFAVLGTRDLRIRKRIKLDGDFSFDARSPDGRWLYLIHYTAPDDPLRYAVRVLDTKTGKLLARPIVDPREPDEAMNGRPLTRAMSRDNRWAYTLYEGRHPFVHALDTVARSARCIHLDWLHGRKDLWAMRFAVSPNGTLAIRSGKRTLALVDTGTFAARKPVGAATAAQR